MSVSLPITASTIYLRPVSNTMVEYMSLCPAAATSTAEFFDGTFGTIATSALGAAGSGYAVGDLFHLVSASGGTVATGIVDTLAGSAVATYTLLTFGTGYIAGTTYATVHDTGAGNDALTITASTVTDEGTSVMKLSAIANISLGTTSFSSPGIRTTKGISVRLTGAGAKAYCVHE